MNALWLYGPVQLVGPVFFYIIVRYNQNTNTMKINEARLSVLLDYIDKHPNGAKQLALLAVSSVPFRTFKYWCETLEIEHQVKQKQQENK